ncbi:MAG: alpha-2-macroglobulin family protein [Bacteroidota bacterium]
MNNSKFAVSIFLLILWTSISCSSQRGTQPPTMGNQHKAYKAEWQKIDSLAQKGLPQSALKEVEALYAIVKKEGEAAQEIKCLIYRSKFQSQLEEDGLVKTIYRLLEEEKTANMPAKALLQSMLGEMYSNYLGTNYWILKDRTTTADFKPEDIRTWTISQLIEESNRFYLASVSDPSLREVNIDDFEEILNDGEHNEGLRPHLFDFLAHRALNYFSSEQRFLTEPAYKFYIDQKEAFAKAATFSRFEFKGQEESSTQLQVLRLFQVLLQGHLDDKSPRAKVVVDLQRLKYVYDKSVREDKTELYLEALEALRKQHADHPVVAEVSHAIATYYVRRGNDYQPGANAKGQMDWKKAHDLCTEVLQKYPDTYGAANCRRLLSDIEQKSLSLTTDWVNTPQESILGLVTYRNVEKAYFKVIKITEEQEQEIQQLSYRKHASYFRGLEAQQEWSLDLPQVGDFRIHRTEIKIDPLGNGLYLFLVADNEQFSDEKNALGYMIAHVSGLAYWNRNLQDRVEFFVTDRKTGQPLEKVKATFYKQNYNSNRRRYDYIKIGEQFTDVDGWVSYKADRRTQIRVRFSRGEDELFIGDNHYARGGQKPKPYEQMNFFLDRAIYRPGQQIFFKGIAMQFDEERMPSILPNKNVTVTLFDVNNQKVESLELRTNEYGTVSGTFVAPGALLGRMHISCKTLRNSRINFSVEEYKRPKFEVAFDKLEGSYKLGDQVTVKGQARAFAGSVVDGAKVQYRVVRNVSYPYWPWYYWGRGIGPRGNNTEIANGTTTTDAEGRFEIEFNALPDRSTDPKEKPQFNYKVYADVVDITGETRSNTTTVKVGYVALLADVEVANEINRDSLRSLQLSTTNLNGEFEGAEGSLTITALEMPKQTFRTRYWNKPDQFLMDRETFSKNFPHDAYKDEGNYFGWPLADQVFSATFNTNQSKGVALNPAEWAPGKYVAELKTKDKYGKDIEVRKYFTLYDLDSKVVPGNNTKFHVQEKDRFEPGETLQYYFGSAEKDLYVLHEVSKNNVLIERKWLTINELQAFSREVQESDRGNFEYHLSFVRHNRSYSINQVVRVPWTNKELKVEYATFRDKLYPGQDEEWRIKISGQNTDRVAAEMLVSMYDASLDQFVQHGWSLSPFPTNYSQLNLRSSNFRSRASQLMAHNWQPSYSGLSRSFRHLNWFDFPIYSLGSEVIVQMTGSAEFYTDGAVIRGRNEMAPSAAPLNESAEEEGAPHFGVKSKRAKNLDESTAKSSGFTISKDDNEEGDWLGGATDEGGFDEIQVRTNLKETVFFMPDLLTDEEGNVIIKFKMNEALTRWKFMGLAHTKDLKIGLTTKELVTQKDLMVLPNAPRFLREADEIEFTAKVSNLTEEAMQGEARLQLFDAISNQPVDALLGNTRPTLAFNAAPGQSARLAWTLKIPVGKASAITHRIVAKAGNFSDGEESSLPILSNRMMVTETLPLAVRGGQQKNFTFKSLKAAGQSATLQHHKLTLEFTSNPAWYAVQALPYLMEYPYQCTEQIFSRFYANSLASAVANSQPRIKTIFEQWKNSDALLSNLSKNQELKSLLLEETPWVLQAQSEAEQKKNIGLLFDMVKMAESQAKALRMMSERQLSNGGFSWFPGGRDNWYMTQYIVEGMGHLDELGANNWPREEDLGTMVRNAVRYTDARITEHYNDLKKRVKQNKGSMDDDHLDNMAVHYLYARSFFSGIPLSSGADKAADYYLGQSEKYWNNKSIYMEGMIALALHRNKRPATVADITKSLKERALQHEELGRYWKYDRGFYWHELPIETHALMIELFEETTEDAEMVDDLKVWLLKNKQTKHWKTTKATAAAVYALLRRGDNWLAEDQPVEIALGGKVLDQSGFEKEPGTGYFKTSWEGEELNSSMGEVKVNNPNKVVAWGGLYWQYFEQLDQIKTFEETPLTLRKQLFREEASPTGPVMRPISEGGQLQPGDKLKVRIELRVDRGMEYVHMKDMRASGLEPINLLSQYKWQGGLGYYESTGDAATNFFFAYLPPGTHVFEYPLRVNHKGNFSNGITSIQCMYAPEFSSHSEGIRLKVE